MSGKSLSLVVVMGSFLLALSCSSHTSCPQACTPYTQQCTPTGILVCAKSIQTSCFGWAILPCPTGTSCQENNGKYECSSGGTAKGNCQNPRHKKQCVGQTIHWFDACGKPREAIHTCPQGTLCQKAQCKPTGGNGTCSTPCKLGTRRCTAGDVVETCSNNNKGCAVWNNPVKCASGNVCQKGKCILPNNNNNNGGCTNQCQAGQVQCLGSAYQNCSKAANGCFEWTKAIACPSNQTCKDGRCQSNGTCKDPCRRGYQRCAGQQYQVCEQVGQCNQWGAPQSCGSGQQCQSTTPTIRCVCLPGYLPKNGGQSCYKDQSGNQNNNNGNNNNGNNSNCSHNAAEQQVLAIVNQERQKAGRSPLQCNSKLAEAARKWSTSQCGRGGLSHANLGSRVRATGLRVSTYGENVAYGSRTPAGVMNMWMNSSGHRRNILSSSFSHIGVGLDQCNGRYFWTQIFVFMR